MKQYTGKNLEDLLNEVAKTNECNVNEINYTVIEEEKGFLGLGKQVVIEAFTPKDVKEFIFDYLGAYFTELNQAVAIEIRVEKVKDKENELLYHVLLDAENNGIVIGKNGQTLRAIATVLKAACNASFRCRLNVLLDINHYKEDRYKKVTSIATRVAKEVRKSHIEAKLDPMPNDERKAIHQHLQGFHNIKTESFGEGNKRHIVIKYVEDDA